MNINLNRKAYSLIELVVVIFIVLILMSLTYTAFFNKKSELKKEAIILFNNLQYAKISAIKNRQNVTITFYPEGNYYIIQFSDNKSKTYYLNDNVEFGDGGHSSLSNHKIGFSNTNPPKETFTPLGFAKYSGSIYIKLKNSNDDVFQISINRNGKITIKKWNGNEFVE